MRNTAAARRYAKALFGLVSEEGTVASSRSELGDIAELISSNAELEHRIFRPLHPVAERRAVLEEVCRAGGTSATIRNFFAYLIDQRRLVEFEAIRAEFERLADEAAGRVRAQIVTASPLRDEQRRRLEQALERRTGKQIDLFVSVDPTLLGGATATVGDLVFDGSLRSQRSALRVSLLKGARDGESSETDTRGAV
jgi:F-type H+-transporting ATPase subunit delta